jgi:hypothetical protein
VPWITRRIWTVASDDDVEDEVVVDHERAIAQAAEALVLRLRRRSGVERQACDSSVDALDEGAGGLGCVT